MEYSRGLIKTIVLIILGIGILAYLSVDLREYVSAESIAALWNEWIGPLFGTVYEWFRGLFS